MNKKIFVRRNFLKTGLNLCLGYSLLPWLSDTVDSSYGKKMVEENSFIPRGEKQIFVDGKFIANWRGVTRRVHAAQKMKSPVLEADMPWEQGNDFDGKKDRRVYMYGTVLEDDGGNGYKMWYNRLRNNYYATSDNGVNWNRPKLGFLGDNNMIDLSDFHSPSIIFDRWEKDPAKRYKAIGSMRGGYRAAYSKDGLEWKLYRSTPILLSEDTITFAQDPLNGEYLAFHKVNGDPRTRGRQVFLSVSKDMLVWSAPTPVMVTDETDHEEARNLEGGTHSEFYNMSAFPYANQWMGLVTHFRRTGMPKVLKEEKGHYAQSHSEGIIDVQLVHSRDGRNWDRCSDRSPVIPLGPHSYDAGSILGLCNSPVIVHDEMWMYYTAMTTSHGGYLPDKEMSIAKAAWRIDGMVSLHFDSEGGFVETLPFIPEGNRLCVNAELPKGRLSVEVLDNNGNVLTGYNQENCLIQNQDSTSLEVTWKDTSVLPQQGPITLRFYMNEGDLYSYSIL